MRYDLTGFEWSFIEPLLPMDRRGPKPQNNRVILNGIFGVLRTRSPTKASTRASLVRTFGPTVPSPTFPINPTGRSSSAGSRLSIASATMWNSSSTG